MSAPPPLTPHDSDLRDFRFMPLDVVRLAQSDLVAFEEPAAVVAAILLWGAAWHGVPAGSLSNDDRALARAAGFGRGVSDWLLVKEGALRGFVECSDGRLYHPVVAEKVREAWAGKLRQRHRTFLAAVRKHNERNPNDQRAGPSYEQWDALGRPKEVQTVALPAPSQGNLDLAASDDLLEKQDETRPLEPLSRVTQPHVTRDTPPLSRDQHPHVTQFSGSKGEGQGEGQGQGDSYNNNDVRADPPPDVAEEGNRNDLVNLAARCARAGGVNLTPAYPKPFARELDIVRDWQLAGIGEELILSVIEQTLERSDESSIGSLKFFDGRIRKAHALAERKAGRGSTKPSKPPAPKLPIRERDDDDPRLAKVRDQLKATANGTYATWLAPEHTAFTIRGDILLLRTRSRFYSDYIDANLRPSLERVAGVVDCSVVRVEPI